MQWSVPPTLLAYPPMVMPIEFAEYTSYHEASHGALVLAGHLDADVYVMDQIAFDDNLGAAVHVNTVSIVLVTLTGLFMAEML